MSNINVKPTTIVGIRRLAKTLRNERGIKYTQALDLASVQAGFENYKHSQNSLANNPPSLVKNIVYLTRYWRDRETGERGRETLTIMLEEPWGSLIKPAQLQFNRGLGNFRSEGPDHLAHRSLASSQSEARQSLCVAARNLQFIDATKLRPTKSFRIYPKGRSENAVPGHDHVSGWYEPKSKRYLLVDEPYAPAVENRTAEREAWATIYDQEIALSVWPGMYAPDVGSRMFLIADKSKGMQIKPLLTALEKLPPPITLKNWSGESSPHLPFFVSPGSVAKDQVTRAKMENSLARRKADHQLKKTSSGLEGSIKRKNFKNRMSIETHEKVGMFLKGVMLDSYHRDGVYKRLNSIRCDLDDWLQAEYNDEELPSERFFNVYYRESGATFLRSLTAQVKAQHINNLEKVKQTLSEHYSSNTELKAVLRKLDLAIKSMSNWGS